MHNEIHPRKPWLAALMSLVLPGFGQLYNGQVNRAIWLFLAFAVGALPGAVLAALYLPGAWMVGALALSYLAALALWLYGIVDAWRTARGQAGYIRQAWQVSGMYMLVLIGFNLLALPLIERGVRTHLVEAVRVPQASMDPGVMAGDFLFVDKRYNCLRCPTAVQRGDVAVFAAPNDRTQMYIKRVIGLPGDRVQVRGKLVAINGEPLTLAPPDQASEGIVTEHWAGRRWQAKWSGARDVRLAPTELTVPPGHVFVMGDNRNNSLDSRYFGTFPLQDVVGKARQVWFSRDAGQVRWERIGMPVL